MPYAPGPWFALESVTPPPDWEDSFLLLQSFLWTFDVGLRVQSCLLPPALARYIRLEWPSFPAMIKAHRYDAVSLKPPTLRPNRPWAIALTQLFVRRARSGTTMAAGHFDKCPFPSKVEEDPHEHSFPADRTG